MLKQANRMSLSLSNHIRATLQRLDTEAKTESALDARLDEILITQIQTLVTLSTSVGKRTPDVLEEADKEVTRILIERGLQHAEAR